jgi:dolichol-phosphate mannosyltransferase
MKKLLSLIVPMYNEEEMIPLFFERVNEVLNRITDYNKEIVCVNDGSIDKTLAILKEMKKTNPSIHIVSFSRNFGHEAAVAAGFQCAQGDVMIVMDADLQDPPEVMIDLIEKYKEGYDVVNAKRVDRRNDSFLKRKTAEWYYKLIYKLSGKIRVPENVGNYRLMSRKVVDVINSLPEKNRVFRVLVPYAGFKVATVDFIRQKRPAGKTHYNYKNMFNLAGDSIVASTTNPLKWIFIAGVGTNFLAIFGLIIDLILSIVDWTMNSITWTWPLGIYSIIMFGLLFTSWILLAIGIIGEYMARMVIDTKGRPVYIIEEEIR